MKIYLCRSVLGREELGKEFDAVGFSNAQLVRWRDCPAVSPSQGDFIGICDAEDDDRAQKLASKQVPLVSPSWLKACISAKRLLTLPSTNTTCTLLTKLPKPMQPPPLPSLPAPPVHRSDDQVFAICTSTVEDKLTWTPAQDDAIRAIHAFRTRGETTKAECVEGCLISKHRTLHQVRLRERLCFPQ
ncbi:hypothetical protein BASA81_012359 [Batrachochytrium salamandrivorans]|nr:hypothetical protein BASA81_012359 [Batrachochytrium salamandrivorans]